MGPLVGLIITVCVLCSLLVTSILSGMRTRHVARKVDELLTAKTILDHDSTLRGVLNSLETDADFMEDCHHDPSQAAGIRFAVNTVRMTLGVYEQ